MKYEVVTTVTLFCCLCYEIVKIWFTSRHVTHALTPHISLRHLAYQWTEQKFLMSETEQLSQVFCRFLAVQFCAG